MMSKIRFYNTGNTKKRNCCDYTKNSSSEIATTPVTTLQISDFVFRATITTKSAATRGTNASRIPASNMPGENRSLATSAAKAAGGIKPSALVTRSGSSLPFSRKSGTTLQMRMVSEQQVRMTRNVGQVMGVTEVTGAMKTSVLSACSRYEAVKPTTNSCFLHKAS